VTPTPDKVDFWASGRVIATDTSAPFEVALDLAPGDYKLGFCHTTNGLQKCETTETGDGTGIVARVTIVDNSSPPPPTADTVPPTVPGALRVSTANATSVSVGWSPSTDNTGVAGYGKYRGSSLVGTTTQTNTSFTGLTCGNAYQVGVDAYDTAGNRSAEAAMTVTTTACADTQAPTAPTNLVVGTRTATSIALFWSPSTDNVGVVSYGLYRGGVSVGTTSGTSGIVTGLTCGTNYTLGVDAADAAGNYSPQTVVMVATTACADTQSPTAPTALAVSGITQTALTVGWTASTDNVGVAAYSVYRNGTKLGETSALTYVASGLTCGTSYTLAVEARDAAGNVSARPQVVATTSACALQSGAQVFVTPSGNDATCARGDSTKPCASFDRAYEIAQLGDVVQVAGGSYPAQTITDAASKDTAGDAPDVVIRPAAGATVTVANLTLGGQIEGSNGPDHLTIQGISDDSFSSGDCEWRSFGGDIYDVTFDGVRTCNFTINHEQSSAQGNDVSDGLTIRNSEIGPCRTNSGYGCGNIKIDGADGFLFEDNYVHDFRIGDPNDHFECMFISDTNGATIQRNRFEDCEFYNIFFQHCNPANGGRCTLSNVTIQDNFFDQPWNPQGQTRTTAIELASVSNFLVRFNTFWNSGISVSTSMTNFRVYGNIMGGTSCGFGMTFSYNIFTHGASTCGTNAAQANATNLFVNAAPLGAGGDLHLKSGVVAVDSVTPTSSDYMLSHDYDGDARPAGLARDAGADERVGG
jgi:chitodextrinase